MPSTVHALAERRVPAGEPARPDDRAGVWRRGRVVAVLAVLTATLLLVHRAVPDRGGNLGSLVETFLPWFGLAVPVLLPFALLRRSALALTALALPLAVWLSVFGGMLSDRQGTGGDLTVVTHNVDEDNPDPAGTARALAASGADVLALEELGGPATGTYEEVLARTYRYHDVEGTVGLWSRYPLSGSRAVPIMPWTRALRSTVRTPQGPLTVFVAHLASVRVGSYGFGAGARDDAARRLALALDASHARRTLVLGDFNGTVDDRSLAAVTSGLRSAQEAAGHGFGFSWPASFPVARIDQILVRGVTPVSAWSLPPTGSDHLPVAASLRL